MVADLCVAHKNREQKMNHRERRNNAGNRLSKLLDEEEECQDEFYKVNYGGFEETLSDNDYQ